MNLRLAYNAVAFCAIWFLWLAGMSFWLGVAIAAGLAVAWGLLELAVQEIRDRKLREGDHE